MFAFNLKKEIDMMSKTLSDYFNVDETEDLSRLKFTFIVF